MHFERERAGQRLSARQLAVESFSFSRTWSKELHAETKQREFRRDLMRHLGLAVNRHLELAAAAPVAQP